MLTLRHGSSSGGGGGAAAAAAAAAARGCHTANTQGVSQCGAVHPRDRRRDSVAAFRPKGRVEPCGRKPASGTESWREGPHTVTGHEKCEWTV